MLERAAGGALVLLIALLCFEGGRAAEVWSWQARPALPPVPSRVAGEGIVVVTVAIPHPVTVTPTPTATMMVWEKTAAAMPTRTPTPNWTKTPTPTPTVTPLPTSTFNQPHDAEGAMHD